MKRLFILLFAISFIANSLFAQTDSLKVDTNKIYPQGVLIPRFKIYPTENIWIQLKLDTANGLVSMVQISTNDDAERGEWKINLLPIVSEEDAVPGRFELYPTKNMYNFILLDTLNGSTFQVQWSTNGNSGIRVIKDYSGNNLSVII